MIKADMKRDKQALFRSVGLFIRALRGQKCRSAKVDLKIAPSHEKTGQLHERISRLSSRVTEISHEKTGQMFDPSPFLTRLDSEDDQSRYEKK